MSRNCDLVLTLIILQAVLILFMFTDLSFCFHNNATTKRAQPDKTSRELANEEDNSRIAHESERSTTEEVSLVTGDISQCLRDSLVLRHTTSKLSLFYEQQHNSNSSYSQTLVCQVEITAPESLALRVQFLELSCSSANSVAVYEGEAQRAVWDGCESVWEPSAVSDLLSRSGRARLVLTARNHSLLTAVRMTVRAVVVSPLESSPLEMRMISPTLGKNVGTLCFNGLIFFFAGWWGLLLLLT